MEKIELVKEFLKENNYIWNGEIYSKNVVKVATEKDLNALNKKTLIVKIKGREDLKAIAIKVDINLTQFMIYGLDGSYADYFYINDESKDLLKMDLSRDWIKFCAKNKGLVYQIAAKKALQRKEKNLTKATDKKLEKLNKKIEEVKQQNEEKINDLDEIKSLIFEI